MKQPHERKRNRLVFIVYGHDRVRNDLADFLRRLELEPLMLSDQPRQGRTLLEQIEHHARRATFAIVLLTGDDEGHVIGKPEEKKPRARQNVVLELGYVLGLLGRRRVMVLYRRGVELPSDLAGLHYTEFQDLEDVRLRIVAELKESGVSVDANKAF